MVSMLGNICSVTSARYKVDNTADTEHETNCTHLSCCNEVLTHANSNFSAHRYSAPIKIVQVYRDECFMRFQQEYFRPKVFTDHILA